MSLFRNGVGEKAEAVLRGTSIGEITIRYFVPSASQILDMDVHTAQGGSYGEAAIELLASSLISWSLDKPLGDTVEDRRKVLQSLRSQEVLFALIAEVRGAGEIEVKN